jgi:hypothetical protein
MIASCKRGGVLWAREYASEKGRVHLKSPDDRYNTRHTPASRHTVLDTYTPTWEKVCFSEISQEKKRRKKGAGDFIAGSQYLESFHPKNVLNTCEIRHVSFIIKRRL